MMSNITIAYPLLLSLFVPVLLFLVASFVRRRGGLVIPDKRAIPTQHSIKIFILQAVRTGLLLVALSGLILILAGFSREKTSVVFEYVTEESRDTIVVLDASGSMANPLRGDYKDLYNSVFYGAQDPKKAELPPVFTLAKGITTQLVCERPYDRFGLIIFGSDAYLARTFTNSCDEFKKELMGDLKNCDSLLCQRKTSTEIGNALDKADRMFLDSQAGRSRAVLLISDLGDTTTVNIPDKISTLLSHDVRVYIFAVNPNAFFLSLLEKAFAQEERVRIYRILSQADLMEAKRSLDILQPAPHVVARTVEIERESANVILLIIVSAALAIWVCAQPIIRKIH